MYLLDNILLAFFDVIGGLEFFYFALSILMISTIAASLFAPFMLSYEK